jgi:hypothetical protein
LNHRITCAQRIYIRIQKNKQADAQEKLYRQNREAAGKAREAKKEAARIAREKNLQLVLNMFKK